MSLVYLNGFLTFKLNMAIRLHFTSDYDIFESKGRVNYSKQKFEERNDANFYHRMAGEYRKGDLSNFLMANIMAGCTHVTEYSDVNFREWKSKMQQLEYTFAEDLKKLKQLVNSNGLNFNDLFISKTGAIPVAIQLLNGGHIRLETFCIIDKVLQGDIMQRCDEQISDKFIWPDLRRRIVKYAPWLKIEELKFKKILIQNIK